MIICDVARIAEALELRRLARLARSGVATRFADDGGVAVSTMVDLALVKLVAKAHRRWFALEPIDIKQLAEREGLSAAYVTQVLVTEAIAAHANEDRCAGRGTARELFHAEVFHCDLPQCCKRCSQATAAVWFQGMS